MAIAGVAVHPLYIRKIMFFFTVINFPTELCAVSLVRTIKRSKNNKNRQSKYTNRTNGTCMKVV